MFRQWGADIVNMPTSPEVILANELAIPSALLAMSTDYGCWKTDEVQVSGEVVFEVFKLNIEKLKKVFLHLFSDPEN